MTSKPCPYQSRLPRSSRVSQAGSGRIWLCHKICRKEHVVESMPAKDDLVASGELIDGVKDLIPGVLRHEPDERVQTDDRLLTEMREKGRRDGIGMMTLPSYRMNIRS